VRFNIVTLFPEFFDTPLSCGLMARARESGLVDFHLANPRDFATNKHRSVDDRPYGGGPGMVMTLEPLAATLNSLPKPGRMFMLSPRGRPLDQRMAQSLAQEEEITLICGRYEGIDARLEQLYPLELVSLGDFVLTGGEAAALCLIEAAARLLPGFMGHTESADEESFSAGLLEYPHYTRPEEYEGLRVPETLLGGNHAAVAAWRREHALAETLQRRPELLSHAPLKKKDIGDLRRLSKEEGRHRPGRNLYLALTHYPVVNKKGKILTSSLTNLDLHDISRSSRTYGLGGVYIVHPLEDQQRMANEIIDYWALGPGAAANPDRAEALALLRPVFDVDQAIAHIEEETGSKPLLVATSARGAGELAPQELRDRLEQGPVLMLLGTASGLADEVLERAEGALRPIRFLDEYNHLSVRAAAAIMLDRILGDAW
jgi:tRNA (guanine37-N1)-methyltransferase